MNTPMISPDKASSEAEPFILSVVVESDKMRTTGPHCHSRGQLLGAIQGLISIDADGSRWVVPATHAVWIPPYVSHSLLGSHGPFKGWSVYVAKSACADLPDKPYILELSGLLRETVARMTKWQNTVLEPAQVHLSYVFLHEIRTMPRVGLGLPMPKKPQLLRIALALANEPGNDKRMTDWANWAGISPRSLTRNFIRDTGFTFTEWRQRVRLLIALEMLASGKQVTEISLDLGYDNVSAFITLFRRIFGTTPGNYKEMMRGKHNL